MCPNFSLKNVRQEFDELQSMFGEDMAYLLWNRNNGYHLDKAPNGKSSKLFKSLLDLTDRKTALTIKAKTLSSKFKEWFGNSQVVDENGEPLIVYHGSFNEFNKFKQVFPEDSPLFSGYFFAENKNHFVVSDASYIYPVFLKVDNIKELTPWNINTQTGEEMDHDTSNKYLQQGYDGVSGIEFGSTGRENFKSFSVKNNSQIKSIFNSGEYNRNSDNIYDSKTLITIENRRQMQANGSMSQEILSNFETYFPDYAFYNDAQREIVADMVGNGELQITCTI